ncbi:MAG: hypothetical protein CMD23_05205 [Flavobacteriales bacterium]|nr:hypothetical protein [Flavobacteriales bacterium]|tara:strand:- start:3114 stop:3380 length:267 start_codon:yes stop_codon:yes gene_type:complete
MIFKKDSAILGLFIGVLIPVVFYFLQKEIIPLVWGRSFSSASMQLFALVLNLPFFRYYLMSLKYEKTGKGIFFATFMYGLVWIFINQL